MAKAQAKGMLKEIKKKKKGTGSRGNLVNEGS